MKDVVEMLDTRWFIYFVGVLVHGVTLSALD